MIFIVWMNWRTLQSLSFSSWWLSRVLGSAQLVSHVLEPYIERKDCHYRTSPIGYWGKGSTLGCRAVNEPSFVEWCMFKLGSSGKIKSSSLAWTYDKLKNSVWAWARGKAKKFELGLAWLISQAKLKLNIKLKLELKSSFELEI